MSVDGTLEHLEPSVKRIALGDKAVRIEAALSSVWVSTKTTNRILGKAEQNINLPKAAIPGNVLVTGPSGCGKTSLKRRLLAAHQPYDGGEKTIMPIVACQAPSVPTTSAFCNAILHALGFESSGGSIDDRMRRIFWLLELVEAKCLIIDEVQHALHMGIQTLRHLLNTIKMVGNCTSVRIIAFGTSEALSLFSRDEQIKRRFEFERMSNWKYGRDFLVFLVAYERWLPLLKPSNLAEANLSKDLFDKCMGNTGNLAVALGRATELAITSGEERITREIVAKVKLHTIAHEL